MKKGDYRFWGQLSYNDVACWKNKDDSVYDIVIDPGHGGMDGGASAYGYSERDFTFQIAKKYRID